MDGVLKALRSPVAKWITRGLLYGLGAIFLKLGVDPPEGVDEQAASAAEAIVGILMMVAAAVIDYVHHKKDLAEPPKGFVRLPMLLLLALVPVLVLAAGCDMATRDAQLLQVEAMKQIRGEWFNYHRTMSGQIRSDKTQLLDLAFAVDLERNAVDGAVAVEKVKELIAKRQQKAGEVETNLAALDGQFQQRIDLLNRTIELGSTTADTLNAWAQVQVLLHQEATTPTILPMLLGP